MTDSPKPELVACYISEEGQCMPFIHEADAMLAVVRRAARLGEITPAAVIKYLEPYRVPLGDWIEEVVELAEEAQARMAAGEEIDEYEGVHGEEINMEYLPEWVYTPGTGDFIDAVKKLRIRGVELNPSMGRPISIGDERLLIHADKALDKVNAALKGRYVVQPMSEYEWKDLAESIEEAQRVIAQLHREVEEWSNRG